MSNPTAEKRLRAEIRRYREGLRKIAGAFCGDHERHDDDCYCAPCCMERVADRLLKGKRFDGK